MRQNSRLYSRTVFKNSAYQLVQDTTFNKVSFNCHYHNKDLLEKYLRSMPPKKTGILIVIYSEMSVHRTYLVVKLFVGKGNRCASNSEVGLESQLVQKAFIFKHTTINGMNKENFQNMKLCVIS